MFCLSFPLLRARIDTLPKAIAALALSLVVSGTAYALPYFATGMSELDREFVFCSIIVQAPAFLFGFVVFYAVRPAARGIAPWAAGWR